MEQQYVGATSAAQGDLEIVSQRWAQSWAASGAAGLSGRTDGHPLAVPLELVRGVVDCAAGIAQRSAALGRRVDIDGLALLGERAASTGMTRRGSTSCGGAARLLAAGDGEVVLSLARPDDVDSIVAWLDGAALPADLSDRDELWAAIASSVAACSRRELVDRASLLGLPFAAVGEVAGGSSPVRSARIAATARPRLAEPLVIDLSSLWAGPLCADLLGRAGCRVVKVESSSRPDGARAGSAAFYDVLHGGHESVALDFGSPADRTALRALIARADVVIEASRPRAFASLGIDRASIDGPAVWVSITGHGRDGAAANRIAFGDDAAAAGGLVTADDLGSCFCGDAIADPLTGMVAAATAMGALVDGGRWTIDLALSRVAAWFAGGPLVAVDPAAVAAPRARPIMAAAPPLGADTDRILAEFGIG